MVLHWSAGTQGKVACGGRMSRSTHQCNVSPLTGDTLTDNLHLAGGAPRLMTGHQYILHSTPGFCCLVVFDMV